MQIYYTPNLKIITVRNKTTHDTAGKILWILTSRGHSGTNLHKRCKVKKTNILPEYNKKELENIWKNLQIHYVILSAVWKTIEIRVAVQHFYTTRKRTLLTCQTVKIVKIPFCVFKALYRSSIVHNDNSAQTSVTVRILPLHIIVCYSDWYFILHSYWLLFVMLDNYIFVQPPEQSMSDEEEKKHSKIP